MSKLLRPEQIDDTPPNCTKPKIHLPNLVHSLLNNPNDKKISIDSMSIKLQYYYLIHKTHTHKKKKKAEFLT